MMSSSELLTMRLRSLIPENGHGDSRAVAGLAGKVGFAQESPAVERIGLAVA